MKHEIDWAKTMRDVKALKAQLEGIDKRLDEVAQKMLTLAEVIESLEQRELQNWKEHATTV